MIGQLIGNYKIEEKLGEGGMGAVYKGVDTMLDREVAIKALRPELASQTSIVERFRTEAVTLAKLNHPNIATLYSMFRQGDELYMVLEYVRGATLDSIMRERGAIPAEEAIPVFCQVLDGIDHAHELGIVHRDIKPANMMFNEKGTLKVLDFGIARLLGSARMTRAGNIIGTLEYMAPEQVKGLETDGRSDIYALGMMLYEVLTGRLPFQSENEFELMKSQTEEIPRPPREINPAIPEEVEAAIMKAVQKDPNDRFQTGGEFRESLIGAGFSANGAMAGTTGSFSSPKTHPSKPPVSADVAPPETDASLAKGTRIADVAIPHPSSDAPTEIATAIYSPSTADKLKETRLGTMPAAVAPVVQGEPQPSFFSKLTAVHYVGAGAVVLVLFGLILAIPVLFFVSQSTDEKTNTNKVETKSSNSNQKLDVITIDEPTRQTGPQNPPPPPVTSNTPSLPTGTIGDQPSLDPKQPSQPKPAAPKKQPPAKPKGDPKRAEKLLT